MHKKRLETDIFYFKDMTKQEVVDLLDREHPINLRHNQDLLERVYARYPFISKTEISLIVKTTFQSIRELLVLNHSLYFCTVFCNVKLRFNRRRDKKGLFTVLRAQLSTPTQLVNI